MQSVSIVIRVRNERGRLEELLNALDAQKYDGAVEIIVVDTESTDGTSELAKQRGAKVVTITQADFSYPKSLNAGVSTATNELVALTVAHALPVSDTWLADGISNFQYSKVAGVYCNTIPRKGASAAEKAFFWPIYLEIKRRGIVAVQKGGMGVMGATNCIVRKSVWEKHHFDESFGAGGEDGEWGQWAIDHDFTIIRDPRFTVKHSHGLSGSQLKKQIDYWRTLGEPRQFKYEKIDAIKKGRFDG